VLGLVLGCGSAIAVSRGALGDDSLTNQGWATNLTVGAKAANPWVRARIAMVGLLALNKTETVYFDRMTDESGARLRADCTYQLSGKPLPARWWSITLYAQDNMLARNTDEAASLDKTRLAARNSTGDWEAIVGPHQPDDPQAFWISTRNGGDFALTLRLYNPADSTSRALGSIALPQLRPLYCGKGED
jgi:hypothetical protein